MVPDYYARLQLDPRADRAEIEAALKRMQPVWSMGTRNPKTRHANQLYLDEIPALRKALLGDPASRAAYDAELAMVQLAERDQKLDLLLRRVSLRAAKGGLTATDRRLLADEATRLGLNDEDLLRLDSADSGAGRDPSRAPMNPIETSIRPPTCSTRRPGARFAARLNISAAVIFTMPWASPATHRARISRPAPTPNGNGG